MGTRYKRLAIVLTTVVAIGWLPPLAVAQFPELQWPIRNEPSLVLQGSYGDIRVYGDCDIRWHMGVDLHAPEATDV